MIGAVDEDQRTRLAQLIQARRRELRLSERQAAMIAGVARNTWASAEEGARRPAERSISGIEAALRWAPGSIDRILTGGDPMPQRDPQPEATTRSLARLPPDFDLSAEIDKISRLDIPARTKLELARQITDLYEQAQAERRADR